MSLQTAAEHTEFAEPNKIFSRFIDLCELCGQLYRRRASTTYPIPMSVEAKGSCSTRNGIATR
jgi:hypothetical protein